MCDEYKRGGVAPTCEASMLIFFSINAARPR